MRLHFLSGGRLRMPRHIYYPGAPVDQWFDMPVSCALVKHAQGNMLFDTGCHPDAAQDGEARWGDHARYSEPIFAPDEAVVGQLHLAGLEPGDVDVVICSHLHYDHCGCNAFFPRATIICHAAELEAARAANAWDMGYIRADWDFGTPFRTVDGPHDLFGDGRVQLLPLPGHTPGMMGAHVVLDRAGALLLASDAVPVAETLEQRSVPSNTVDADLFLRSLGDVAGMEAQGARVIYGHDEAQWNALRKGSDFYD